MTGIKHDNMQQVMAVIQQRWGPKALRRLGRRTAQADGIPTGYAHLDRLLGAGGVPRGALTCLSGAPTCGKTTLALDVLARTQAGGEVTVYIDMTGALDPEYAERRGVDLDQLLIVQPQPATVGLEIARDIVASGGAGLLVIDAGLCVSGPEKLARPLQYLSAAVRRAPYALICLAAPRPDRLSAGLVARADLHLRVERQRWLCDVDGIHGYETRLTLEQSRYGPPGQSASIPITLREPHWRDAS